MYDPCLHQLLKVSVSYTFLLVQEYIYLALNVA